MPLGGILGIQFYQLKEIHCSQKYLIFLARLLQVFFIPVIYIEKGGLSVLLRFQKFIYIKLYLFIHFQPISHVAPHPHINTFFLLDQLCTRLQYYWQLRSAL